MECVLRHEIKWLALRRWRCNQVLTAAGGSPVLSNQTKAAENSSDNCCLSRFLYLMLVTSSALHLDSHFYAQLPDNDIITRLILSYKPIFFPLHCSEFRVTVQVNECNFISSERDHLMEGNQWMLHVTLSQRTWLPHCQQDFGGLKVTQPPSLPPVALFYRLWTSEVGLLYNSSRQAYLTACII